MDNNVNIDNDLEDLDKIINKGIIYIIQHNTLPELKYIGQTITPLNKRWVSHKTTAKLYNKMFFRLGFFINYYDGIKNFNIKEFKTYENITQKELNEEEIKYIQEHGTINTRNSNELITIKITNDMRNELIKKFIDNNVDIINLYKLIDTFNYTHYNRERTDFILDDTNTNLLNELLKKTLFKKILNTKVSLWRIDVKDEDEIENDKDIDDKDYEEKYKDKNMTYILNKKLIEDDCIIENYIEYIEYFNKEFEITNDKNDIYYYNDLLYGLKQYGEFNDLFDFYISDDIHKIFQYYFDILNNVYSNVYINHEKKQIKGIKKKNNLSFKFSEHLYNLIDYYINYINYKTNKNYNPKNYTKKCNKEDFKILGIVLFEYYDHPRPITIKNNRLYISKIIYLINHMCNDLLTHEGFIEEIDLRITNIYNTDIEYIYDYVEINKIINDKNKILYIINHILNNYGNEYKIINDSYIIN
jgi:hypothetical protein